MVYVVFIIDVFARMIVGWRTPAEALDQLIERDMKDCVATTG
jgi:transposase InsO family protein